MTHPALPDHGRPAADVLGDLQSHAEMLGALTGE